MLNMTLTSRLPSPYTTSSPLSYLNNNRHWPPSALSPGLPTPPFPSLSQMSEASKYDGGTPSATPPPGAHILVFPFPAQGHIIALLDLAHHLALRGGLSLTVLVTPGNLPLLSSVPAGLIQPLVLPFPPYPSIPAGAENLRDFLLGGSGAAAMSHALGSLRGPVLSWARSHPSPPVALLSDFFLGWTQSLAAELGIPRVVFYSASALLASVFDHLWVRRGDQGNTPSIVSMPEIPGAPSFPYRHLPSLYLRYREGASEWEFMKEAMAANASSWGAVLNTFRGLEGAYLDHLMRERGHRRVWAVGPLLPPTPSTQRGGQSSVPTADVIAWLDARQRDASVVYICFGSQFVPSQKQGAAIAAALERSGVSFVWCVKDASKLDAAGGEPRRVVVPEGFRERTAWRGVVIEGWAPQVAILGHPAVGAFVTHCGWNSVLEGMAAGVALLAWPMEADQFVNARLLAEELGVAVRVSGGPDSVPDSDEFARVLKGSVGHEGGDLEWVRVRARAAEMGRLAADAVGEGGTSLAEMDRLVGELSCLRVDK